MTGKGDILQQENSCEQHTNYQERGVNSREGVSRDGQELNT